MINAFQQKIRLSRLDMFWVACSGYCEGLLNKWWVSSWKSQASGVQWETEWWSCYYHHFEKLGGCLTQPTWNPSSQMTLPYPHTVWGLLLQVLLPVCLHPPCVHEPRGVRDLHIHMWMWTHICTSLMSVCDTCVHTCVPACEYILAIFAHFKICIFLCIYIYIYMHVGAFYPHV